MKKNWIIAIIIFLLVSNLALITTLLVKQRKSAATVDLMNNKYNKEVRFSDKQRGGVFEDKLARDLGLSDDQLEELRSMRIKFHQQKRELKRNMNQLKQEYFTQLAVKNPDENLLKELADSLGNSLVKIILLEHNHYQSIKSICTPEQANKLDSLGKHHIHKFKNKGYLRRQKYSGNN
jgi:Spy/CpxP family protein refolding chaperone